MTAADVAAVMAVMAIVTADAVVIVTEVVSEADAVATVSLGTVDRIAASDRIATNALRRATDRTETIVRMTVAVNATSNDRIAMTAAASAVRAMVNAQSVRTVQNAMSDTIARTGAHATVASVRPRHRRSRQCPSRTRCPAARAQLRKPQQAVTELKVTSARANGVAVVAAAAVAVVAVAVTAHRQRQVARMHRPAQSLVPTFRILASRVSSRP